MSRLTEETKNMLLDPYAIIIGVIVVFIAVVIAIVILRTPNPPLPTATVQFVTAKSTVSFNVEIASTSVQQARGLSFRPSLDQNDGLLFTFGSPSIQNFWMKDMNFPIDIIWISSGTVAGFAQNAEPQPGAQLWQLKIFNSPPNVDTVLEVNAGIVAQDNIQVGDTVKIIR
jgi:uncharacterized membrane protein (UPF0127 family)